VVLCIPNSGRLVFPTVMSPAARNRAPNGVSTGERKPPSRRGAIPHVVRLPFLHCADVLEQKRHCAKGSIWQITRDRAAARASSYKGVITALSVGFKRSIRASAASTSSSGVSCFRRTGDLNAH
jgi:hypothetical protein